MTGGHWPIGRTGGKFAAIHARHALRFNWNEVPPAPDA
jgi:hypothetical protein